MDSVAESSKNRKRLREEEEQQQKEEIEDEETSSTDQTLSLVDSLTFSDTMVALRIMRAQFPHIDKVSIQPFILHSQLYSSVKDRTQVDRELESLRREKVLRVFKLNTGQDDYAIMFLDDYLTQVDRVVKRMEEKKQRNLEVFEWFKTHVIDNKQDPSIDDQELRLLLSLGGKVKDEHISLLINAGLLVIKQGLFWTQMKEEMATSPIGAIWTFWLAACFDDFFPGIPGSNGINGTVVALPIDISWTTRQLIDPNMYWFAIPNIGSILKGLSQGRKELLSLLNRQRYKEMMLAPLEKKRLRLSLLDMRFHLRDLIGSGHLKTVNTPTGLLVRVSKD
ncbi:hypothetical protein POTOM_021971 [Populus tomentosa]|uniref:Serine/threonine-protein kinase 19 n=1 Tax=Populus tomentosa TaxID=118781 RepID=A0A8X7ZSV6_POPTO|nr:hypothetical protein POTOM_021971 [Populus tomentosa]